MWTDATIGAEDRLLEAMELYRKAGSIVRDAVAAELMGMETPASYDRLERDSIENGGASFEARKLDQVTADVQAILTALTRAGFKASEKSARAQS